jgi:nitrate reductase cytochrome c-type subunit
MRAKLVRRPLFLACARHKTHPVDIERALKNDYSRDARKRDLQLEAKLLKRSWRRGWDSNPLLPSQIRKLQIPNCQRCHNCHTRRRAFPTIAHRAHGFPMSLPRFRVTFPRQNRKLKMTIR